MGRIKKVLTSGDPSVRYPRTPGSQAMETMTRGCSRSGLVILFIITGVLAAIQFRATRALEDIN